MQLDWRKVKTEMRKGGSIKMSRTSRAYLAHDELDKANLFMIIVVVTIIVVITKK